MSNQEFIKAIVDVMNRFRDDGPEMPDTDDLWRSWLCSQICSLAARLADEVLERNYDNCFVLCVGIMEKAIEMGSSLAPLVDESAEENGWGAL